MASTSEIRELHADVSDSPYYSPDMAPTRAADRVWRARDLAVLWISMAACVPTYMLASSLIDLGMNWSQAIATIVFGNCVVLIPCALNAHAGTRYGISFPVYCRASFGLVGANVPALLRALVACAWFGIQTTIGGQCLHTLVQAWWPDFDSKIKIAGLGLTTAELGCFLAFWLINVVIVWRGIHTIRVLLNIKAPLLIALGLILLGWACYQVGGLEPMLTQQSQFSAGQPKEGQFWSVFFPALTANIAFWATLSLNIPDFSRFAVSQRAQVVGQAVGLPPTMALYSFIGVAVTSATQVIYGEPIWNPVVLLQRFDNKYVLTFAMLSVLLATVATNIAANVVGPANDFAHMKPKWISVRTGGLITAILGVVIQPWRLLGSADKFVFAFLDGYSLLLGACGGVLIADYWVVRRANLDLEGLYRKNGPYWYTNGWNWRAVVALVAGIAVSIPGFVAKLSSTMGLYDESSETGIHWLWERIYDNAWFASFGLAFVLYLVLMIGHKAHYPNRPLGGR